MNPSFSIRQPNDTIELNSKTRFGKTRFTVTNNNESPVRARAQVVIDEKTNADYAKWYSLEGDDISTYTPKSTQGVTVQVSVPPTVPAGKYTFYLSLANMEDPDEDYSESNPVTVVVPLVKAPFKFPWKIIALIAVCLVIIIGIVVVIIVLRKPSVPDVVGKTDQQATKSLQDAGYIVIRNLTNTGGVPPKVISQEPGAGTELEKGSSVTITVVIKDPKVPIVPNVIKKNEQDARKELKDYDVKVVMTTTITSEVYEVGFVVDQDPRSGIQLQKGKTVYIYIVSVSDSNAAPSPDATTTASATTRTKLFTTDSDKAKSIITAFRQPNTLNTFYKSSS
jgi:hypothetical protein